MNQHQSAGRVAQPAEEELKKHGDQLEQPVERASRPTPQQQQSANSQDTPRES